LFISETGENSGKIATIPSFVKHSVSSVGVFDTAWLFRETTSAPPPVILQLDYIHALRTKMPAPQYQSQTKRRGSLSAASQNTDTSSEPFQTGRSSEQLTHRGFLPRTAVGDILRLCRCLSGLLQAAEGPWGLLTMIGAGTPYPKDNNPCYWNLSRGIIFITHFFG